MSDPQSDTSHPVARFLKRRWLGLLIALLAIIFVLQNGLVTQSTTVNLFFWQMVWPNWLLLAVVFLAGMLVAWLLSRRKQRES